LTLMTRNSLRTLSALCLLPMLAACSESAVMKPVRPNLPPAPALFGLPVPLPVPQAGSDARAFAAMERASLLVANGRLKNDGTFYGEVRKQFSR
jgi:hypothetical protein